VLVRDFMTPNPKTLKETDTLKDAAFLFYKYKIGGAAVVTAANEVCGFLEQEDIVKATMKQMPASQAIADLMNRNVIVVYPENTMEEAWQIPQQHLPVVNEDDRLVGILSRNDFLNYFYARLRRSQDEAEALIHGAHSGVIIVNSYGIVEVLNEVAAKLVGVPADKAKGNFIRDIVPHTGLMQVLVSGKKENNIRLEINGQELLVNRLPICEGPKIVGAIAIIQDVSKNDDIMKTLDATQHKVEAMEIIFESLKQGIVVLDENNIVTLANKSYEEMMGIPREELLGRDARDAIENSRMHIVLKTGVPELADLQSVKGRQVVVNRVPIFKDGMIIGAIGEAMFKDISEVGALLQKDNVFNYVTSRNETAIKKQSSGRYTFDTIIGRSRAMVQAKNLAAKAAQSDSTVLILGESGTGKELFAHAIHNASKRRAMPLVPINCAAIPSELLESELFGYEEGAFTGAKRGGKKGKFELADEGTIFLDEIGDMPLAMQAKLLRIMQDKTFERVGGEKTLTCDVRIIAATNKPLTEMVHNNTFREDLYYRLNVISIQVPPLRERREDIGELIDILIPKVCHDLGIPLKQFAPETLTLLREYNWPGNVRELINMLEQLGATVSCPVITPRNLPPLGLFRSSHDKNLARVAAGNIKETIISSERDCIVETLRCTKGNKALAAKVLGIHRSTLYEKMKKYRLA